MNPRRTDEKRKGLSQIRSRFPLRADSLRHNANRGKRPLAGAFLCSPPSAFPSRRAFSPSSPIVVSCQVFPLRGRCHGVTDEVFVVFPHAAPSAAYRIPRRTRDISKLPLAAVISNCARDPAQYLARNASRSASPSVSLARRRGMGAPAASRVALRATSRVLPPGGKTYRVRTADISRGTLRVPHSYLPISVFSPFTVFGEYVQQNDRKPPDFPDYANLTSAPFPWYNETVIRGPP